MSTELPRNPFRGLRPFEPEEAHLFFGRKGQIADLLDRLHRQRFLAVVGSSGCGKSSLVRAGVIASLREGFMAEDGGWRIAVMRPGDRPMAALVAALKAPEALGSAYPTADAGTLLGATLRRGALGLVDAFRQASFPEDTRLFVLVDQFEELFRFQRDPEPERATETVLAFVALLLEASVQRDLDIYVALTMRSEYLGLCDAFPGLPEAINEGLYLVPRMTREQVRQAIEEPIRRSGAEISARLVDRLLNDLGLVERSERGDGADPRRDLVRREELASRAPDQLPVLQHALTRLWVECAAEHPRNTQIDLAHYERVGRLGVSLSNDADRCLEALTTRDRQIAQVLFRRLTEVTPDGRMVRREARLEEICRLADATPAEVVAVIDPFRDEGRSFLMPPPRGDVTLGSVIDISHESLIRQWTRLRAWTVDEARSAAVYRRLASAAARWKEEKGSLWRDPELAEALDWQRRQEPTAAWAAQYGGGLGFSLEFLRRSRRRQWTDRLKSWVVGLAALAVLAVAVGYVVVTQVNTGIRYRILWWDGRRLAKPEKVITVSEVRDWVTAQLLWDWRGSARATLKEVVEGGASVEDAIARETADPELERRFLLLFRDVAAATPDERRRLHLLRLTAPALARAGEVKPALDIVERLPDPGDRLVVLREVARRLREQAVLAAPEIARRAREWAHQIPDLTARAQLLTRLAAILGPVGGQSGIELAQEARAAVRQLSAEDRVNLQASLAAAFLFPAGLPEAERLTRDVRDEDNRDDLFRQVAVAWVAAGRPDRALDAIKRIGQEYIRDLGLSDVARALAVRGNVEDAFTVAEYPKVDAAFKRTDLAENDRRRDVVLRNITAVFVERSEDEAAHRAVGRIGDWNQKVAAWRDIADAYCRGLGPSAGPLRLYEVIRQANLPGDEVELRTKLVCALIRTKSVKEADQVADRISDAPARVRALLLVARADGTPEASQVARSALERARAILGDPGLISAGLRVQLLSELTGTQVERRDPRGALETAKELMRQDKRASWEPWTLVAVGMARSGCLDKARDIVATYIGEESAKLSAYARVLIAWKRERMRPESATC